MPTDVDYTNLMRRLSKAVDKAESKDALNSIALSLTIIAETLLVCMSGDAEVNDEIYPVNPLAVFPPRQ